jgi:replication factor A2
MEDSFYGSGGGFMPEGGNNVVAESPATPSAKREEQRLLNVTIRQLQLSTRPNPEAKWMINNVDVFSVTFIGCIVNVVDQSTFVKFTLEDGTGTIQVSMFKNDDEVEEASPLSDYREGSYIRVVGSLKDYSGVKSITAFKLRPVTDHNELTYHLMSSIYQHVNLTKGDVVKTALASTGASVPGASIAVWGSKADQQNTAGSNSNTMNSAGGGSHQDMVMNVFRNCHTDDDQGLSLDFIHQQLKGSLSALEIRKQVDYLSSEGHLYSTTDDDHYKSTEF